MQQTPAPAPKPLLERPLARIAIAAVLLAVLGGAAFAVQRARGDGAAAPSATSGTPAATEPAGEALGPIGTSPPVLKQPAPDFVLRNVDGTTVKLSDLRGKVVWVNFWATWCVPCKKELPDIQRLYDEKRDQGLEVLTINYQEGAEDAQAFFDARSLTLPLLLDDGAVYEQYRLQGLPDSFFIDRDGNIAALQYGFLTEDKMRERLAAAGLP
jgi:thiol-disulfide isomerase/thioredoxin